MCSSNSRVEGLSETGVNVIITDVVYSTETKTQQQTEEEGEGEFERLRGVVKEKQKEMQYLEFTKAALIQQKTLLKKYADHVSNVSAEKVYVYTCIYIIHITKYNRRKLNIGGEWE